MSSEVVLVYLTASSMEEAKKISRTLVEERLAACVNIIDKMRSIYRWKGKIEEGDECILIAKTRADLYKNLEARVKQLHSYDVPCILEIQVPQGSKDYLSWIAEETK